MRLTGFTGANFTGRLGERFSFQTLDGSGCPIGSVLEGQVKRIFRQGGQISVELYIPDKRCTHIHEGRRIYFRGAAGALERAGERGNEA